MKIDWVQTRRIGMGVGAGFLIAGIGLPIIFPQEPAQTLYQTIETVKTVEVEKKVEVVKWKTRVVKQAKQERSKETIYSRNGDIRIIERESLITKDSSMLSGSIMNEQIKEKKQESQKTATTMERGEKLRYGLGVTYTGIYPLIFDYKKITIHGYANVADSRFWLHGSYAYPLTFSIGGLFTW